MNHALKITTAAAALLLLAACDNDKGAEGAGGDASGATVQTVQANMDVAASLPLNDQTDFEQATRGLIAKDEPLVITKADGTVVWDRPSYDFVTGEAPASVNPSLWRQAQLNNIYGLFEVAEGVYQVRGYDLANMSIIDGPEGRVIVDPLTSVETAQKALALVERELGKKPIVAVIHTHSHIDHFGGIEGIVSAEDVKSGKVKIIAPEGFLEEATSENILAGIAMGRRAAYMYGAQLDRSPQGHIGTGLGKQPAQGTFTLMEPTDIVDHTGQTMTIAGIEFVFQYAPDSEAPAVLTFYLPHVKAFSGADNLTRGMHNLYTLRGAKVRDALKWTAYTDEIIELFGDTEVMFNSHNWPLWGNENFISFLKNQRDMYRFIHDQTLRYANQGYTPREIAEMIKMPEALDKDFSSRSYYGTTKHNAKAVYQHYFGWYDANPSNLDPLPPEEEATRYVDAMGGVEAVIAKGQSAFEAGEFRWVATLMSHAVFADPENAEAKKLLASAYEQLAYQAESAPWRDVYLMGAKELREGKAGGYIDRSAMNGILSHVPASLFFSAMASWIDAEKADGEHIRLAFNFTDIGETHVLELENAVLHHTMGAPTEEVDATINLTRSLWMKVVGGSAEAFDFLGSDSLEVEGSRLTLIKFFRMLDQPEPNFNIVTP